jgi:hypothetical protein
MQARGALSAEGVNLSAKPIERLPWHDKSHNRWSEWRAEATNRSFG